MDKFMEIAKELGLIIDKPIANGSIQRVAVEGTKKASAKDGAYCIYNNPNGTAGWISNNRTGEYKTVSISGEVNEYQKGLNTYNPIKNNLRQNEKASQATYLITKIFKKALYHKYLCTKKISPYGALVDNYGVLIIPLQNIKGEYRSFQRIYEDGSKSFFTGGQKKECFFLIGKQIDKEVIICEGYSTAATIYQATKIPTIAAMDAGNIEPVAKAVRDRYGKDLNIIIAGDDDALRDDNPGRRYATKAAESVNASVVFPKFTEREVIDGLTDFNDLYVVSDNKRVRLFFEKHSVISVD